LTTFKKLSNLVYYTKLQTILKFSKSFYGIRKAFASCIKQTSNTMQNFQLNIQNPCHEAWEDFRPTPEGGFCASCQKNVIDFSEMTESQLVAYFRDLSTDNQHLCGRFRNDQLQKDYRIEEWFPTFSVTDKMVHYEIPISQFRDTKTTISLPLIRRMKIVRNMTVALLTFAIIEQGFGQQKQLSGQVVDASDGSPLPGVSIVIKGTTKGVASDVNGEYQITVNEQDTLVFSSIGFERKTMVAKGAFPVLNMQMEYQMMGEVVVTGYHTKGKMDLTAGGISICRTTTNETNEKLSIEQSFTSKFKTDLKVLGNPTVSSEVIVVTQLHEKVVINDPEERAEAVEWYANNGFQNIKEVQVYDLSGRTYSTDFHKMNDGKINVNLTSVPAGMHLARVKYSNERSIENEEIGVVRIWVKK
jgi:CarboxypepD_reg-like domain